MGIFEGNFEPTVSGVNPLPMPKACQDAAKRAQELKEHGITAYTADTDTWDSSGYCDNLIKKGETYYENEMGERFCAECMEQLRKSWAQERTCETCGDDACKGEPHPDHRQITCPDWQPKQPADTVQLPGEAEKVLMGDQYELIMSVRRLQDAHTRSELIKAGWKSPEQVEAKLKEERAKEAAWLENNWWKGKPEIFARIAELEGKKP